MKIISTLTAIAATLTTIQAKITKTTPSSNPDDFRQYFLKTKVIAKGGPHRFNDLYVYGYHTGAGLGDVGLVNTTKDSPPGFMNGTHQQFKFNEGDQPYYPWGLVLPESVEYTGWQASQINVGFGDAGFFMNDTGLQRKYSDLYSLLGGWRVCDWWHGVPQLFWKLGGSVFYTDMKRPSSCADVLLMPEYA